MRAGIFPVVLEITPPRRRSEDVLLRRARRIRAAAAVNVIQRSDRLSSLEASAILMARGLEPVWHLANRGRSGRELRRDVERASTLGLRGVLCIRGDHRAVDREDTPRIRQVVELVRSQIPDALIGVTMNQYLPKHRVLRNLLPKVRAGARFIQAQPVFGLESFLSLASEVKERVPDVWILPMLMPLLSTVAADRLQARTGVRIPPQLLSRLARGGESSGWEMFRESLAALYESPLADGVALMTLELDPDDRLVARLESALREVGLSEGVPNSASTAPRNASSAGLL